MPETLVPTDSTASSVAAVATVLGGGSRGRGQDARPAATACPPRLRRVAAFMSAKQAIAGVESGLIARETAAARSSVREPEAAPTLATVGPHSFRAPRAEHAARQHDGKGSCACNPRARNPVAGAA